MRRMLRSGAALWMLLLFPLTACETKRVWLEFPAFGDGSVEGVWLWRRSDASGAWERRHGHLRSLADYDGGYRIAVAGA